MKMGAKAQEKKLLPISTVTTMHRISGEECHPDWRWWLRLLSLQTAIDPSVWARKVDHVLVGGDPLVIACRIEALVKNWSGPVPIRIALLHPGTFSGAPLAALEDEGFRQRTGIARGISGEGPEAVRAAMSSAADRAALLLAERGGGGVFAFEMLQGMRDDVRDELVFKMTRKAGVARSRGPAPSAGEAQVLRSRSSGEDGEFYRRSEAYWREGLAGLFRRLDGVLDAPPCRKNFADLVISRSCELLSGFISPPAVKLDGNGPTWLGSLVGQPYRLAGRPPATIGEAIFMWSQDFARAGKVPISCQDKEIDQ